MSAANNRTSIPGPPMPGPTLIFWPTAGARGETDPCPSRPERAVGVMR